MWRRWPLSLCFNSWLCNWFHYTSSPSSLISWVSFSFSFVIACLDNFSWFRSVLRRSTSFDFWSNFSFSCYCVAKPFEIKKKTISQKRVLQRCDSSFKNSFWWVFLKWKVDINIKNREFWYSNIKIEIYEIKYKNTPGCYLLHQHFVFTVAPDKFKTQERTAEIIKFTWIEFQQLLTVIIVLVFLADWKYIEEKNRNSYFNLLVTLSTYWCVQVFPVQPAHG